MKTLLQEERFNFISPENKAFISAFGNEISKLGYGFGGSIGSGFCWGKYMIIYSKLGVKSKKVVARIYIRENCIVLRLFLNKIDKHREYIENAIIVIMTGREYASSEKPILLTINILKNVMA